MFFHYNMWFELFVYFWFVLCFIVCPIRLTICVGLVIASVFSGDGEVTYSAYANYAQDRFAGLFGLTVIVYMFTTPYGLLVVAGHLIGRKTGG